MKINVGLQYRPTFDCDTDTVHRCYVSQMSDVTFYGNCGDPGLVYRGKNEMLIIFTTKNVITGLIILDHYRISGAIIWPRPSLTDTSMAVLWSRILVQGLDWSRWPSRSIRSLRYFVTCTRMHVVFLDVVQALNRLKGKLWRILKKSYRDANFKSKVSINEKLFFNIERGAHQIVRR